MQIPDFDVADDIQLEEQKKRENTAQIKAYQDDLRRLDLKERETMSLYVADQIGFDGYREMKTMVDKEKAAINAELEKLRQTEDEPQINKADIINNFRENWAFLSAGERRQFLLQFMKKITLVVEKQEGVHLGNVKILDVEFLPSYEKQRETIAEKRVSAIL